MSNATSRFVQDREDETENTSPISALRIETGDELQQLCVSLKQMEGDLNTHIENIEMYIGNFTSFAAQNADGSVNPMGHITAAKIQWKKTSFTASSVDASDSL